MFEKITSGITLLNSAAKLVKNVYDVITTISGPKQTDSNTQKIENNIYYLPKQEIFDISVKSQKIIENIKPIGSSLIPIQNTLNNDIIFTNPILTPQKFKDTFCHNPNEILYEITELDVWKGQQNLLKDKTFIPVIFPDKSKQYIGWLKIGYAKDYCLGYKSINNNINSNAIDPKILNKFINAFRTIEFRNALTLALYRSGKVHVGSVNNDLPMSVRTEITERKMMK